MHPKVIYRILKSENFPDFLRGDTVLTNNLDSTFANLTRLKAKRKGVSAHVNHEEIYLFNGKAIGANEKVVHQVHRL